VKKSAVESVEKIVEQAPELDKKLCVHQGHVVEEADGDLMGDGVNIAARLEGVCEPGAICLSEDAYRQVKGRLDLAVTDLGPTQLKNIAEPIRLYSSAGRIFRAIKRARASPGRARRLQARGKGSPMPRTRASTGAGSRPRGRRPTRLRCLCV